MIGVVAGLTLWMIFSSWLKHKILHGKSKG